MRAQEFINEISNERLQQYLSRAGRQVDARQERMARVRDRLNKGYEIYHADAPSKIVHHFDANTPAEAQRYYADYIDRYESDVDYDLRLRRATGIMESTSNTMSTEDMIAYLRQHHDTNLHQDYLDHVNTNSKFILKDIPLSSISLGLSGLDRAKVEKYKKQDPTKAPPIVVGSDGYILDGYHRATAVKELGIPTIRAYVGVKGVAEAYTRKLNFDEIYGKYLKVTDNNGDPGKPGFSLVTPLNGDSWNWRERPEFIPLVKKKLNQPGWLGNHKYQQIVDAMAGRSYDPTRHNVKEAFDQPYPFKWSKSEADESADALARLPDGSNLSIMFNQDYDDEGQGIYSVEFWRDNSQEVTGAGDAQRVFATVLKAISQFIKKRKPEQLYFSANKDVEPGQKAGTRSNLYTSLVRRYANAMGYEADISDFAGSTTYKLYRLYEQSSVEKPPTFDMSRRSLNVPELIKRGAIFITHPHGKNGWELNQPAWDFSLITLQNVLKKSPPWSVEAPKYIRPESYQEAIKSKLWDGLGDEKYKQILWSIKKLGIPEQVAFLDTVAENFADGKNPGRKGLSKRVGIPKKATLGQLEKIARSSTGERRRMAQWQLNMRRGKAKKNK